MNYLDTWGWTSESSSIYSLSISNRRIGSKIVLPSRVYKNKFENLTMEGAYVNISIKTLRATGCKGRKTALLLPRSEREMGLAGPGKDWGGWGEEGREWGERTQLIKGISWERPTTCWVCPIPHHSNKGSIYSRVTSFRL